ncbi:MAG: hypothetical protein AAFR87_23610 [Bacteroidota bacterium]
MSFIRFTEKRDYLIDEIQNGFLMMDHNVHFQMPPPFQLLEKVVLVYKSLGLSVGVIGEIIAKLDQGVKLQSAVLQVVSDQNKKSQLDIIFGKSTYPISMKCFTELRENQKIDPHHIGYFGKYGIEVGDQWMQENGGAQVLYIGNGDEWSQRLGSIISLCSSLGPLENQINSIILDIVSYIETSDHRYEYEWRIVNPNKINSIISPDLEFKNRIPLGLENIEALYIPEDETPIFEKILEEQAKSEQYSKGIPDIRPLNSIILTPQESDDIANILRR